MGRGIGQVSQSQVSSGAIIEGGGLVGTVATQRVALGTAAS